ncbi:hypothetical protein GCM10014719_61640 [Planomonospora parontospora subsp. antibiotica]|nr:hypothetical protein GCM10014719_61640 [Planomonospora parontospora subsp. antibiotica]GII19560.1 hypothetical protein Ppa05_62860 [Planomonospora parontospora subsp. antibiotica]
MPEAEAARRVEEIIERRVRCGDPDREKLGDEPVELVAYLVAHRRVSAEVLRRDVLDALVLLEYARRAVPVLPGRLDRLEHRVLTLGIEAGLSLGELAAPLGLRSRQAVQHRLLRHAAAERGASRSEVAERAARRAEARERAWLDRHGADLLSCAGRLLAHRDLLAGAAAAGDPGSEAVNTAFDASPAGAPASEAGAEIAEAFDELAESLSRVPAGPRDPHHAARYVTRTRHLAARLRLLLADLAAAGAAAAVPAGHPVHALLARTARLAAAHQSAAAPPPPARSRP